MKGKGKKGKPAKYTKADFWRMFDIEQKFGYLPPEDPFMKSIERKMEAILKSLSKEERDDIDREFDSMHACEYWNSVVSQM